MDQVNQPGPSATATNTGDPSAGSPRDSFGDQTQAWIATITDARKTTVRFLNSLPLMRTSRYMSLVKTSLQRGMGWLGLALKSLGSASPYVHSEDPSNRTIDAASPDFHKDTLAAEFAKLEHSHTVRVKYLRSQIPWVINMLASIETTVNTPSMTGHALLEAYTSFSDAKMWLGWELGDIRDAQAGKADVATLPEGQNLPL